MIAWVLGGQILFEISRSYGKLQIAKVLSASQIKKLSHMVEGKGLLHAILVRMVVHGDMVSYAFGLFTNIPRWEFGIVSAIGVAPAAILYAYFGSLPTLFQFGMIAAVVIMLGGYALVKWRNETSFSSHHLAFQNGNGLTH